MSAAAGVAPTLIRAHGLGRSFGDHEVLRGLDLAVAAGAFVLVTGRNGAGKSTLLQLLAGLLAPSAGELEIALERSRIGYLGHDPLVYRELTAAENLELYGRLYRIPDRTRRIDERLGRYGLAAARDERVGRYSRGMTQRLALCRALLHEPELLLLDEPYAALDREGATILDEELATLAGTRTIVLSSHQPERVDALATIRVAFS